VTAADSGLVLASAPAAAQPCSSDNQLIVLSGDQLEPLLGTAVEQLALFRASDSGTTPISFQLDRKDAFDRYIIEQSEVAPSNGARLDANDELVFLATDAGRRLGEVPSEFGATRLVEIKLPGGNDSQAGWIYVSNNSDSKATPGANYVRYDRKSDVLSTATYRIGFDGQWPFLVDSFHWRSAGGWSSNLTDTMKIRHRGRFLGLIPFQRTHGDYRSDLITVKTGPLRVIRRTENRIRVLWHLKTPALYIDYVMAPSGFTMDTVIEIPFNVGLFFSDLETLTSVDWRADGALPRFEVSSLAHHRALSIDGRMSREKRDFNLLQGNRFAIDSSVGAMVVSLEIPPQVPITPWLYLRDALDEPDPPENDAGQFGNVGFKTTGWEGIDREVHHVKFSVCLEPKQRPRGTR
jgi:hypothetical protein